MIGYKDMTWCTKEGCMHANNCYRYLTPQDKEDAIKWWGGAGFPIAVGEFTCYEVEGDFPQYIEDMEERDNE